MLNKILFLFLLIVSNRISFPNLNPSMDNLSVFSELKIIDLSTVLAGPSVGSFFAELGAQVQKIENPNRRDITRDWKLPQEDKNSPVSAYFSSVNYGKKYINLDLTKDQQREVLFEKLKSADIILMNFKKGDQEKLKISDEKLHQINPQLIIGKINGFGKDSNRLAYDLILQAETGIMSMNGTIESGPVKMPVAFIDVLAAHHLKQAILIELIIRNQSEYYKGKVINVSLYDAVVSSLVNQASNYLMQGFIPERMGSLHPNIAPYGELFETSDGKIITFAIGSNRHFSSLCNFLQLKELPVQHKFKDVQDRVENRQELYQILLPEVKKLKAENILNKMKILKIPCGEVKNLEAVFATKRAKDLIKEETINGVNTKRVSAIAFKTN